MNYVMLCKVLGIKMVTGTYEDVILSLLLAADFSYYAGLTLGTTFPYKSRNKQSILLI